MHFKKRYLKIALTIFFLCSVSFMACTAQRNTTSKTTVQKSVEINVSNINENILLYINQYRQNKKLDPLQLDSSLSAIALQHSVNMANKKVAFGHDGFEDRMQVITTIFSDMKASAENVAYGKLSAEAVVKGWINSPHHKKNIEGNYNLTGIGVAKDSKGISYFTQIFIH